ncbi:MAG: ABC transporter permease [Gemmataceae bacterium]
MSYALATLWHDRQRFLPGVLAVAFSALLIALQCGLLLGLFSITSLPIDETRADIWVGHPAVHSVDLGRHIPIQWQSYLSMPEVTRVEHYRQGFAYWSKPSGGAELCLVIGSRLGEDALGAVNELRRKERALLTEPGSVIIDESEFDRLGVENVGDTAEINGFRVRIVGTVTGYKSLAGPYIFCSLETARPLLRMTKEQTTFILARCTTEEGAKTVVQRLQARYPKKLSAFTAPDFSIRSRVHWLTKTKAGIALGFAAALGLFVGAVVTYQTLSAATLASIKEYAVLRALGIPRWRMAMTVLTQSFWVGVVGVCLALPFVYGFGLFANWLGAKVHLPWWLLTSAVTVTMCMALISGLTALRTLRHVEPMTLLR